MFHQVFICDTPQETNLPTGENLIEIGSLEERKPEVNSLEESKPEINSLEENKPEVNSLGVKYIQPNFLDENSQDNMFHQVFICDSLQEKNPGAEKLIEVTGPEEKKPEVNTLEVKYIQADCLEENSQDQMFHQVFICDTPQETNLLSGENLLEVNSLEENKPEVNNLEENKPEVNNLDENKPEVNSLEVKYLQETCLEENSLEVKNLEANSLELNSIKGDSELSEVTKILKDEPEIMKFRPEDFRVIIDQIIAENNAKVDLKQEPLNSEEKKPVSPLLELVPTKNIVKEENSVPEYQRESILVKPENTGDVNVKIYSSSKCLLPISEIKSANDEQIITPNLQNKLHLQSSFIDNKEEIIHQSVNGNEILCASNDGTTVPDNVCDAATENVALGASKNDKAFKVVLCNSATDEVIIPEVLLEPGPEKHADLYTNIPKNSSAVNVIEKNNKCSNSTNPINKKEKHLMQQGSSVIISRNSTVCSTEKCADLNINVAQQSRVLNINKSSCNTVFGNKQRKVEFQQADGTIISEMLTVPGIQKHVNSNTNVAKQSRVININKSICDTVYGNKRRKVVLQQADGTRIYGILTVPGVENHANLNINLAQNLSIANMNKCSNAVYDNKAGNLVLQQAKDIIVFRTLTVPGTEKPADSNISVAQKPSITNCINSEVSIKTTTKHVPTLNKKMYQKILPKPDNCVVITLPYKLIEKKKNKPKKPVSCRCNEIDIHLKQKRSRLCCYCGNSVLNLRHLRVHEEIHHLPEGVEIPKSLKCLQCLKRFLSQYKTTAHNRVRKCKMCSEQFDTVKSLRQHMGSVHGFPLYPCTLCKKVFSRANHLKSHSAVHSTVLSFCCYICDKSFKSKHLIEQHMITHSNERPISCGECGDRFKRKTHLKQHMTSAHGEGRHKKPRKNNQQK